MSEKKTVYQAIAKVQDELAKVGISKDKKANTGNGGSYSFRGIDDVYNALSHLLSEHGLCILPRIMSREVSERQSSKGTLLFYVVVDAEFDFVSADDGSKHTVRTLGEAMDSGDKATSKAMSTAYKYACFQTFCIPTEGDDAENQTHEVISRSVFKNAALRKTFFDNVDQSFNSAETLEELNTVADLNKPKFKDMRESGNEHDALAVDELLKRYKAKQTLLQSSAFSDSVRNEFQPKM